MLAPVTHYLSMVKIRRRRVHPGPVRLVVRKGQYLSTGDNIALDPLSGGHLLVDIERGLGLTQEDADKAIQCQVGEAIKAGDVLAGPVGISHRVVRALRDGRIVWAREGKILIELEIEPIALKASMPGEVEALFPERGIEMVAFGSLVQGVWGNGQIRSGMVRMLSKNPDQALSADMMDLEVRGSIVVAGHCDNSSTLQAAVDLGVGGIIFSSMDPILVSQAIRAPFPIILVEGFGRRTMNPVAFEVLLSCDGKDASLNAEQWDRHSGCRPEVIIPAQVEEEIQAPAEAQLFAPGCKVRVLGSFFGSRIGRLVELHRQVLLPNGLKADSAVLTLEGEEIVSLPLANLEVLTEF